MRLGALCLYKERALKRNYIPGNSIINLYSKIYNQMATPVDFPKYLQSLIKSYESQPELYTLTDLQVEVRVEISPEDRSPFTPKNKPETKKERLEVLSGIRKYLDKGNVLLVGKPGSGKSTVLQRFRWELAREALKDGDRPIPILVQLRSDRSIEQAICAEFRQAKLRVSEEAVKDLLLDGKLLLLLDGVNEIPSQQRRQEFQLFRGDNSDTPMIFTTRDLALGGSLGIEKKLEMCALTEAQMREFVHKHLPQHGDSLLRQLRDRLREIAETPLLLWMMCEVFEKTGEIPQSKGELFQKFDYKYEQFKGGASVSDDFRRFKSELLQQLALVMLQGDLQQPTEGLVAISRDRAEGILECWLHHRGVLDAPTKAKEWLEDLLEHHLLQVAAKPEEIEFHHQLFQEYYAGRALLKLLVERHDDATDDERLQHFYLNYFKWTEPLAFMLSLLGDEVQAVRVVRLALEVDVMLGARLAGEVKREFQKRAVGLVDGLDVPGWLKVGLLGEVRSDDAISGLLKFVENSDFDVRNSAANVLGKIGSEAAIPGLLKLVEDSDSYVRWSGVIALGKTGSDSAIPGLFKSLNHSDSELRKLAATSLVEIGSDAAIIILIKFLKYADDDICSDVVNFLSSVCLDRWIVGWFKLIKSSAHDLAWMAVDVLRKIDKKLVIPELFTGLLKLLKNSESYVRYKAVFALGIIGSELAISELLELVEDSDNYVREMVAYVLGRIGSDAAISGLLKLVKDSDFDVRCTATIALAGKKGSDAAIPNLLQLVKDSKYSLKVAIALNKIGLDAVILQLIQFFEHSDSDLRKIVAYTLGKIGSEKAIPGLLKLLNDSDSDVRRIAAYSLEKLGSKEAIIGLLKVFESFENLDNYNFDDLHWMVDIIGNISCKEAIPGLLKLFKYSDNDLGWKAAYVLGKIASEETIPGLLKLVNNSDYYVRVMVAEALGEIGSKKAIPGLLKLLEDSDPDVRGTAAYALGKIGSEKAISGLFKLVKDSEYHVREKVAEALGEMNSEQAISELLKLLKDVNSDVREMAAYAIANIAKQHTEAVAPHLPHLLSLISSESVKEFHRLILAIQAACKYYNYPIRQLSLLPESRSHPANASASVYIQSIEEFKLMSNQPPIFNQQNATIGVNYAAENSNPKVIQKIEAAQESSPEAALNAVVQIIQALEKKYTYVKDEEQALNIIDAEFKEIKEQKPIEWQNLISLKRLYNGGKNAAVKVGEHFAESNPWGKGIVAFIEGVSEDVK